MPDVLDARRVGPDELWMINSTSGTTGLPKCVMHTQNRWFYLHLNAVDVGRMTPEDRFMSVVPVPYGFGQWSSHFSPCYLGAPTVVTERFEPAQTLELLERERVTVLCAVSTQFRMLLADPSCEQRDLSALRVMFTGGEAVPYEAARRFEQTTGAAILQFYGSNESGFATATSVDDPPEKRLRTAGRARAGTELRLYDEHGHVTAGRRGQPGTRGPAVCLGYLDDVAANAELFTEDGFLLHADIVEIDDDGYLSVVGRTSDLIIRGGKNISAREVEDEVSAHPRVALAAAVPIPDPVFGERVCVYVELRDEQPLEFADLVRFLLIEGSPRSFCPSVWLYSISCRDPQATRSPRPNCARPRAGSCRPRADQRSTRRDCRPGDGGAIAYCTKSPPFGQRAFRSVSALQVHGQLTCDLLRLVLRVAGEDISGKEPARESARENGGSSQRPAR